MKLLTDARKVFDALLTALAVVFGLTPDPTAVPVPVRIDEQRPDQR
jgi:hypothetical protein